MVAPHRVKGNIANSSATRLCGSAKREKDSQVAETETKEIYPDFEGMVGRDRKEARLGQRGVVVWFCGLSGSGKSTIAQALEERVFEAGYLTELLDGDTIRSRLNRNLGFSEPDRDENIRRIAEVARLFCEAGLATFTAFISPRAEHRETARRIIGEDRFIEVYVRCSYETCGERDTKGLYARAEAGEVSQFTGRDSVFEEPTHADIVCDTESEDRETCVDRIYEHILPRIALGGVC